LWEYRPNWWREALIATLPFVVGLLIIALLFFGLRLFWQWLRILWLIARSKKQKITFQGREIWLVYAAQGYEVACFNGLGKNYLFWSESLEQLAPDEKVQILTHELAHLLDKDGWWLIAWRAAQGVFWANPAYYYLKQQLAATNEFCADAAVINGKDTNPKSYARLLLKLKMAQISPTHCLNLFFAKSLLHNRISRIVSAQNTQIIPTLPSWFWAISILTLFWAVATPTNAYLQGENIAFYQYEILKTASQKTGLSHICLDCIPKK